MIVVTGATGKLGRLVIESLLKEMPASSIAAAVRNRDRAGDLVARGMQVRVADYNQPEAWDAVLKGAEKVLLISSSEVGQRVRQHCSVIDAARRAGVKLLAYTSILRADKSPMSLAAEHKETEVFIRAAGIPYAFLRNGWYTENYTAGMPDVLAHGAVYGCAGNGRIASAARADYAEAAAKVLTAEDQAGRIYELAGDTAFTLAELAAEISRQSGRSIGYVNLTESEYRSVLVKAGLPDTIAALFADSDTGISKGALFDESHQLSRLINRPTTSLAASVAAMMHSGHGKK
jgi:NAD(P)H dehydrogenase (quinone)